jgi:hypothetical protein
VAIGRRGIAPGSAATRPPWDRAAAGAGRPKKRGGRGSGRPKVRGGPGGGRPRATWAGEQGSPGSGPASIGAGYLPVPMPALVLWVTIYWPRSSGHDLLATIYWATIAALHAAPASAPLPSDA